MDIPAGVRPLFVTAGWRSGRRVHVDGRVPELHPAYDVLQEVGGLHVGRSEPRGIECARSDLEFCFCNVDQDILSTWSELLRSRLMEVAEVHNRHGWLLVDQAGRCFGASRIHDALYFEGQTFGEAVERLLLGRKARPMLRPDQDQVDLYGSTFSRGHPAIFDYRS
jgi:SUKH-3 immunity protein